MSAVASSRLDIVVVGSGRVGSALATNLRSLGHSVQIAGRSDGCDVGLQDASATADVTVLAVPFAAVSDVVAALGLRAGSVLVDATNPFGAPLPDGFPSGVAVVQRAAGPDVHVVKAFNVLGAEHMESPPLPDGARPLLPVAADDDDARRLVEGLATDMGFHAVGISGLANAALLEEAARYWGLLAFNGGLGRSFVLVAHQRPDAEAVPAP